MIFSCFVTGTDTEIGKTCVTRGLMQGFKQRGFQVAGMKPIASGCVPLAGNLRNEDALMIQQECSQQIDYTLINPYAFSDPIAPNLAAEKEGCVIRLDTMVESYKKIASTADIVIVEGVGGWRVPIGENLQTVDLVRKLDIPVVLVVGLRLGCISHALLSYEALLNDGIQLLGWVANQVDAAYGQVDETIVTISSSISAPLLGKVPYLSEITATAVGNVMDPRLFDIDS